MRNENMINHLMVNKPSFSSKCQCLIVFYTDFNSELQKNNPALRLKVSELMVTWIKMSRFNQLKRLLVHHRLFLLWRRYHLQKIPFCLFCYLNNLSPFHRHLYL